MHPAHVAATTPRKAAYIMAESGVVVTYGELEATSNRCAHMFRALGLAPGHHIALLLPNAPGFFEVCWGAQRAGLYFTPISTRLLAGEVNYIVRDSGATVFITSSAMRETAEKLAPLLPAHVRRLVLGEPIAGYESCDAFMARHPTTAIADQVAGSPMLYSSGTTGRPKGIKRPIAQQSFDAEPPGLTLFRRLYRFDSRTVYLSPAPLYHAAPLAYCMGAMRFGATVVVMEHFDAERALALIERYRVTHSQWVPTMFSRMLRLAENVRLAFDLSSQRVAIHASAPCPVPIKRRMIEWWGPIVHEYYAGTEGNGVCAIASEDWLEHPGSVGRALIGELRIVREDGTLAPPREAGTIYFANGVPFEYHNDPEKTREARTEQGWSTLGDIGYIDEEGYLYLTDRKAHMIISGGVNIYPQETENLLASHPMVADVAVIGVPNEDLGEEMKAIVQPMDMRLAGSALERELIAFCGESLARLKCPRSIDFAAELPRDPTGKLFKRVLRERYWTTEAAKATQAEQPLGP